MQLDVCDFRADCAVAVAPWRTEVPTFYVPSGRLRCLVFGDRDSSCNCLVGPIGGTDNRCATSDSRHRTSRRIWSHRQNRLTQATVRFWPIADIRYVRFRPKADIRAPRKGTLLTAPASLFSY